MQISVNAEAIGVSSKSSSSFVLDSSEFFDFEDEDEDEDEDDRDALHPSPGAAAEFTECQIRCDAMAREGNQAFMHGIQHPVGLREKGVFHFCCRRDPVARSDNSRWCVKIVKG